MSQMIVREREAQVGSTTTRQPKPVLFVVDDQLNKGEQRFDLTAVFHGLLLAYHAFIEASKKEHHPGAESIAARVTLNSRHTGYFQVSYARAVPILPTKRKAGILVYGNTNKGGVVLEYSTAEILNAKATLARHFSTARSLQGVPQDLTQLIKPDLNQAAGRAN